MIDRAQSDDRTRLRREKSREAIALALEGKWERATRVNQEILRLFPDDVDALNRLGKAFLELGRYSWARTAFENATRLAPYNPISKKNLERLSHLQDAPPLPKKGKVVAPDLLVEESGKSGITVLRKLGPPHTVARMAAGDSVRLQPGDHAVIVENHQGEYLGEVEPKLGLRLIRLIRGGNRYDAAIISVNRQDISVIIWETYRHPDVGQVYSLSTRSRGDYKGYWREALIRYDIDSELEDEGDPASGGKDTYVDEAATPDGGAESSQPRYPPKAAVDDSSDGDDEEE